MSLRLAVQEMRIIDWFMLPLLFGMILMGSIIFTVAGLALSDLLFSFGGGLSFFFFGVYIIGFYKEYFKKHLQGQTKP